MAEATNAATNAVKGAFDGVSSAAGFVARNSGKVVALGGAFLLVAALVATPATATTLAVPGIAALKGKATIGFSELGAGVMEGVTEGAGKLADGATWAATKLNGITPAPTV
jgi:hypothetical protein